MKKLSLIIIFTSVTAFGLCFFASAMQQPEINQTDTGYPEAELDKLCQKMHELRLQKPQKARTINGNPEIEFNKLCEKLLSLNPSLDTIPVINIRPLIQQINNDIQNNSIQMSPEEQAGFLKDKLSQLIPQYIINCASKEMAQFFVEKDYISPERSYFCFINKDCLIMLGFYTNKDYCDACNLISIMEKLYTYDKVNDMVYRFLTSTRLTKLYDSLNFWRSALRTRKE